MCANSIPRERESNDHSFVETEHEKRREVKERQSGGGQAVKDLAGGRKAEAKKVRGSEDSVQSSPGGEGCR